MNTCKQCLKEFLPPRKSYLICSKECRSIYYSLIKKGKPLPARKRGKTFNCIYCSKEFYAAQNRIDKGKVKYCSRSCLAKVHFPQFAEFKFKKTGLPHHTYKTMRVNGKNVRIHRYIMEQHLGRKLESWEHVHHKDNNPHNNSLDNLVVLSNSDHQKEEHKFRKSLLEKKD
jgi:hypothetical protein